MEDRLHDVEQRLDAVEADLVSMRRSLHKANGQRQIMQNDIKKIDKKTDEILSFMTGAQKIYGVARKHWKSGLTFGCGLVTAVGFTNPAVAHVTSFISKFFGLH
jgi:hypothetical protein